MASRAPDRQELSLTEAAQYILEETRMVTPGIQAIFGFQLIAVFSARFTELTAFEQDLHHAAIALIVVAMALIMTPAAYHRHQEACEVTYTFVVISTRLLLTSMVPLALALCIDFYLVGQLIVAHEWALGLALGLLALLAFLWGIFPRSKRLQRALAWRSPRQVA
jgi:hypothetical protein